MFDIGNVVAKKTLYVLLRHHYPGLQIPDSSSQLDYEFISKSIELRKALTSMGLYSLWLSETNCMETDQEAVDQLKSWYELRLKVSHQVSDAVIAHDGSGIWLKGWSLLAYYKYPWQRLMTDLDLLVDSNNVVELSKILKQLGYAYLPQKTPWPKNFELVMRSPEGVLVEIHDALGPRKIFGNLKKIYILPRSELVLCTPLQYFAHSIVHFFQHAGHLKPIQMYELGLMLQNEQLVQNIRPLLKTYNLEGLYAWVWVKYLRMIQAAGIHVPKSMQDQTNWLPIRYRKLWERILDKNGIYKARNQYQLPKAVALLTKAF